MGRLRKLLTILAICCISSTAFAEFLVIPPWQRMAIDGKEYACYDFQGAKKLKLMDNDCHACQLKLTETSSIAKKYVEHLEIQARILAFQHHKIMAQDKLLNNTVKQLEETETQRDLHVARDILGGGFPWLLATLLGGIVIGGTVVFVAN
jgi:hypothetical protein